MLEREVLIGKRLRAVDADAARAVAVQEVAALHHEVFDDAVEFAAFVALWSALGVLALAGAELPEVFGGFGDGVGEELHLDSAEGFACVGC